MASLEERATKEEACQRVPVMPPAIAPLTGSHERRPKVGDDDVGSGLARALS